MIAPPPEVDDRDERGKSTPCPSCKSREGSRIVRSTPEYTGRSRTRMCRACGVEFFTYEKYPKLDKDGNVIE